MDSSRSALPDFYYFVFAAYEPLLCIIGFLGTLADPKSTHDGQAPWTLDVHPPDTLPRASLVTIIQLAHVCALMGVVNFFVLTAVRRHLSANPALQEKLVFSLLCPLLMGDIMHLYLTLWSQGDHKWDVFNWSPMLWATVGIGFTLIVPRVFWHLGIGRYMDSRDSYLLKQTPK
ncbi:hypothetical protein CPB85DRAFT_1297880 [Mucidula mucida]|nr:hypothetical protein CPB85DRAFT_1297880 [Mucidula mucida]